GRGGFLQVTSDLLRRVEVWSGKPKPDESRRTFDVLSRAFDFNYKTGAFGKTLLESVDQVGSDGKTYATNKFGYFDDVRRSDGTYDGFASSHDWSSGGQDIGQNLLGPVGLSALGASETTGLTAHAYLGFSPSGPDKDTSAGGALTISGDVTEALAEMLDINGDGLPDKVYRRGGSVLYRLNASGPHGDATFGAEHEVANLGSLSGDFGIGVAGGPEAYIGASVQFNLAADFSVGTAYFDDVNNDGLPDFASNGTVLFDHLDASGTPTFSPDSSQTAVPLGSGDALALPHVKALDDLAQQQRDQSPLLDTVRRWVAPFAGTVSIDAPVTFDPPPADPNAPASGDTDGVRVAIQRGDTELWAARLASANDAAHPTGVGAVTVARGQAVYFRVQSVDSGSRDQVHWAPRVTYTDYAATSENPVADVNGLSQSTFDAGADFTLAGRPDTQIVMPLGGTVHFAAVVHKSKPTTDDVDVLVLKNGVPVIDHKIAADTVSANGITVAGDFAVAAPNGRTADKVTVKLAVDSPIDISGIQWTPRLYYTAASKDGQPVQTTDPRTGQPAIELAVPADTDVYPNNNLTAPATPWMSNLDGPVTVHAELSASGPANGSEVFLTVKQRGALVGKAQVVNGAADVDVTLHQGQAYWFDLTVRDAATSKLSEQITGESVQVRPNGAAGQPVPHTLNWNGHQDVFPISYRGWGYAGYNGDGARAAQPIDPGAFVFRKADFPSSNPHGFDDTGYKNPIQGDSYPFVPYQLPLKDAAGNVTGTAPVWRGIKDDTVGGADFARSSRKGVDDPGAVTRAVGGAGAHAVTRLGIAAPTFGIDASLGPFSGSFALGPSFGLLDQIDLNGDGFPDAVAPGSVQFTGPRGGYYDSGGGAPVVEQNSSFSVGVGFNGAASKVNSNSKGTGAAAETTPSASGEGKSAGGSDAAAKGGEASKDQYGLSVGGQLGISAEFTNPGAGGSDLGSLASQVPGTPAQEQHYADVNGDGLPDLVRVNSDGVYVSLNLGYDFGPQIKWSGGGFQAGESYSGSVGASLGFQWGFKEFAGGLALNQSVDFPRYAWLDVNGDGIPDRLRKDSTDNKIYVAFGTGAGVMGEVEYGHLADGAFDLTGATAINGGAGIPIGQQVAEDKSQSLGGAVDFTIAIPVCPDFQCYIIVNPGVDVDQSFSSSQIQLADINGDGYPDSLSSTSDNTVGVRLNQVGRTNLLRSVTNSLGGQIRLDYQREGNTVTQPASQWVLSSVQTDDGRPGDGADTLLSTYTYSGANYSRLERQQLGYGKVTEYQRADQGDGNVYDDPVLRSTERDYRNATVFDSGLVTREQLRKPDGTPVKETRTDWQVVNLADDKPLDLTPPAGDPANTRLLGIAGAPEQTKVEQLWYDAGGTVGERTWNTFEYDDLGNVVKQVDVGQPEDPNDDLTALTTYSNCDIASSGDLNAYFGGCPAPTPAGRLSPLWNAHRCPTWTSLPARFQILDAAGHVLRSRDGAPALCDNSSVTDLKESIGDGKVAETNLSYDSWGSYNHIAYPANAGGKRLVVDYVYDPNNHANVAQVDDSHGLRATATFDGRTGRIASRTDVNGQTTSYGYDAVGRLASITSPYEQGSGHPTVSYEYFPTAPGYAYALAHNYDAFNPTDTIDTATFVDGSGRVTQTKQDASVFRGAGSPAADVMVVSGAGEFDALGRPVKRWHPLEEALGHAGTFNEGHASAAPSVTDWNLSDQVTNVRHPDATDTATAHGFGGKTDFGASLFTTTVTDANGKQQRTYTDVHDDVRGVDDLPANAPPIRTRYAYDPLGELTRVTDNGGNPTTHGYNLLGERTSTQTPDGGLVQYNLDGAGNLVSKVTPTLRAAGQQIDYRYDIDRLIGIDYPSGTPSVKYDYGTPGSGGPHNGIGRVIGVQDGARDQHLTYDPLGQVAGDTTTMQVHNLNDSTGQKATYNTGFTYDAFGRMRTVAYPDGEVVTDDYDSGGLLRKVSGVKSGTSYGYLDRLEYDEFFDRRFQQTANGVQTLYAYDPLTRRLARQSTDTTVRRIQDLNYSYDHVGNVVKLDDQLPPPKPNLYGGPSSQTYHYDPYYRLSAAEGTYSSAPNKQRDYTYKTAYDVNGNLISKSQTDVVGNGGNSSVTQKPTTYTEDPIAYSPTRPHQISKIGTLSYTYDADGNFTGWTDGKTGQRRTVTWDAADRMRSVADQGSTTTYTSDAAGALALTRGPSGETAFVNPWYTVRNSTERTKQIWAGNDRLATQRVSDSSSENMRYFLHKDLQGSTNMVTDNSGLTFQHLEWFPAGEPWIVEQSTDGRTPYQYTGGYLDDTRNLTNLGARWYEPREQFLYSPDPALTDDPARAVDDPASLAAYSYAESDPLRFVDLTGRTVSAARAALSAGFGVLLRPNQPGPPPVVVQAAAAFAAAAGPRAAGGAAPAGANQAAAPAAPAAAPAAAAATEEPESRIEKAKSLLEAKPLVEVNLRRTASGFSLESVKLSPTLFVKQFSVFERSGEDTAKSPPAKGPPPGSPPHHQRSLTA
ncbi:MAG: hypothetical protein QOD61_1794, partial [Solirubrobacteraceae bacterium]|nr:hypothetical protein [Solirubrobacteraceae bacterium]